MNWKELYALVNENIKNAVSGLYKPAGDVTFAELPELSQSVLGYTYTVTDAFTTDSRFTDYDTETQTGHSFPADTEVAVIVTGTTENPVYMFNVMGGIMDGYATKGDLDNYVEKEAGKGLSSNDYTDADKVLVQDSPITVSATGSDLTLSTSSGKLRALTIYGKSEVVDSAIVSAGEGYAVVRLADLTWSYRDNGVFSTSDITDYRYTANVKAICAKYNYVGTVNSVTVMNTEPDKSIALYHQTGLNAWSLYIKDTDNTTVPDFVASLGDAELVYELADPTQGNTIAIKTDNGSGINGTMATFSTGTPLRGIPDSEVRDVMAWDGSVGTVTKKCEQMLLGSTGWAKADTNLFYSSAITDIVNTRALCSHYTFTTPSTVQSLNNGEFTIYNSRIYVKETQVETGADFKTFATTNNIKMVYAISTPTTEQLTSTENDSIAALRTFEPTTHAQNNAGATMTVEAYAGTANGKAVNELKQNVQSEISALKITQSGNLTLTTADWTNNAQTVTYAHDTAKRNVIDVDPASVEEWANCGVLATAETATSITFSCKTVPTDALMFRVTSMGVN